MQGAQQRARGARKPSDANFETPAPASSVGSLLIIVTSGPILDKGSTTLRQKSRSKEVGPSSGTPLGLLALHLLAHWRDAGPSGLLFLAESEDRAERLGAILHGLDEECGALVFRRQDTLPFDGLEPSPEIAGRRASVLRRLSERPDAPLLLATPEALIQRVPRPASWNGASFRLRAGQPCLEDELKNFLAGAGYEINESADYPGGALFHGNAIEIFPAGGLGPVRIEQSEGAIRSIHAFDPVLQIPLSEIDELVIDPMSERLTRGTRHRVDSSKSLGTVFEYAPFATLIADAGVPSRAQKWLETIEDAAGGDPETQRAEFMTAREWQEATERMEVLPGDASRPTVPNFSTHPSPRAALRKFMAECRKRQARFLFTAADQQDLRRMERLAGVVAERCATWNAAKSGHTNIGSLLVDFEAGFIVGAARPLIIITASDVLGSRAHHLEPMAKPWVAELHSNENPRLGGVVVHLHRGLGVLRGLETLSAVAAAQDEMVRLGFAEEEAALIPVAELALVWPYAADPTDVRLDRADGSSWQARRAEAEKELEQTAAALSELVSERKRRHAPKIAPPPAEYERFVARFPYFATPGQTKAIEDVLNDLASGRPMNRVVCGDVGFGKTEVALRAAAATVFAGKQVAVAVPTTVLARQHVLTFQKRFAPFGIEIGHLSSFTSVPERRAVKDRLRDGRLRIVIGTHALASKNVKFSELGLVIIDEEQHFGVADKERLSRLGEQIHTLAMSATPIPRTLATAMVGLRDVSVIATPPVQRTAVSTKVSPIADPIVAAALRREQGRHGQSFVICPRIQDLEHMLARLRRIVPELNVIAVHGKLPVRKIDDRMMNFVEGRADVLLATNIVENGLDIPRANTIVICWPEKFGLAQLHQLRGRVGRGGTRAFAYFLTEAADKRSRKRIAAIEELNKPGAGFEISARDLDARGAGDLLSSEQSGHVKIFGPALYSDLLSRAMSGNYEGSAGIWVPEVHLGIPALLPASYVQDEPTRLEIYARAAKGCTPTELEGLEDEMQLRFGDVPVEASNLIALAALRLRCRELGITRVDAGPEGIAATVLPGQWATIRSRLLHREENRIVCKQKSTEKQRLRAVEKFLKLLGSS
jgi:transcription-repair coupling factor (superfamily II helicase)